MSLIDKLSKELQQFGVVPELLQDGNPELGSDLAMPCFSLAKQQGKNPQDIAAAIAEKITHPSIAKAEAVSGYLNVWFKPSALASFVAENQEGFGTHPSNGKTVVVEVGSLNMSKPFGAGHLRPTFQGDSLARLYRNAGYKVVTDNHVGDWGTPFGKWVAGVKRYSSHQKLSEDGIHELARVYIQITEDQKKLEGEELENLNSEISAWLTKLENGEQEALAYHQQFLKLSFDHMHFVLGRLGIATDNELGESFYIERGMKLVEELVGRGVATRQEDGSVIIDLSSRGIDTPMLVQKSNGSALYATSDLATAEYRQKQWSPDLVLIPTGQEQKFYFEQLSAALSLAGIECNLHHHWFGLIEQLNEDGTRGKMSSRKGVVLVEDLLDFAEAKARELNPEASESDVSTIALGALKFTDLAHNPRLNVLFDWDEMFSLSGYCGPYVQYACVRVKAVVEKAQTQAKYDANYDWASEARILSLISRYPEVNLEAAVSFSPDIISRYVYDLAKEWNRYYESTKIVGSKDEQTRLWFAERVFDTLSRGLSLLGIGVPSKM